MREQEVSKALEEIFGHKLEDKEFEYNKKIKNVPLFAKRTIKLIKVFLYNDR